MERRKFIIGTGALASGAAAAIGTGAFSAVEANRSAEVNVVEDSNAYLGIEGDDNYTADSDQLEIVFDDNGYGEGLNANSNTEFTDLLTVSNQGTNDVLVWLDLSDLNDVDGIDIATSYLSMEDYEAGLDGGDGTGGTGGNPGDFGVILTPGSSADIALRMEIGDAVSETFDTDLDVYAAAEDSELFQDVVAHYDFDDPDVAKIDN